MLKSVRLLTLTMMLRGSLSGVCLGTINTLFQSPLTQWLRRLSSPILSRTGPRDPLTQGLYAGLSLNATRVRDALARREKLIEQTRAFSGRLGRLAMSGISWPGLYPSCTQRADRGG